MSLTDVEDEPEKLRRNTLSFSVFTIIFNFLQLRFPETVLGFDRPAQSDGKIWLVIILFSIYFFARYHYCDDAERHALHVSDAKKGLPRILRQKGIDLMLALHGRGFRWNFLSSEIVRATREASEDATGIPASAIVLKSIQVEAYNPDSTQVNPNQLGYAFFYADGRGFAGTHYAELRWPWWFAALVWCRVWLSLITNLKFIVNVYIPYVMFVVAFVWTVVRFVGMPLVEQIHWRMIWYAAGVMGA
jgi:hypothetical protein